MSVFTHFFLSFRNDIVFSSRLSTFYTTFSAMMKVFLSVIIEEKQFFWTICIAKIKMNHLLIKHSNKVKCIILFKYDFQNNYLFRRLASARYYQICSVQFCGWRIIFLSWLAYCLVGVQRLGKRLFVVADYFCCSRIVIRSRLVPGI